MLQLSFKYLKMNYRKRFGIIQIAGVLTPVESMEKYNIMMDILVLANATSSRPKKLEH